MKRSNLVHIGAAIKSLIAESPLQERLLQHQIKSEWQNIAGPLLPIIPNGYGLCGKPCLLNCIPMF